VKGALRAGPASRLAVAGMAAGLAAASMAAGARRPLPAARRRVAPVPRQPGLDRPLPDSAPAQLKVLWTYEAGESIESSAAIADGAVFVAARRRAPRPRPRDGRPALAVPVEGDGIASPRPRWRGHRLRGRPQGQRPRGGRADGRRVWVFKTGTEVKASPVVAEASARRLLRPAPLRARRQDRPARLEARDRRPGARDGRGGRRSRLYHGLRPAPAAVRVADGKEIFEVSSDAYTGAPPLSRETAPTTARSRTRCWAWT